MTLDKYKQYYEDDKYMNYIDWTQAMILKELASS